MFGFEESGADTGTRRSVRSTPGTGHRRRPVPIACPSGHRRQPQFKLFDRAAAHSHTAAVQMRRAGIRRRAAGRRLGSNGRARPTTATGAAREQPFGSPQRGAVTFIDRARTARTPRPPRSADSTSASPGSQAVVQAVGARRARSCARRQRPLLPSPYRRQTLKEPISSPERLPVLEPGRKLRVLGLDDCDAIVAFVLQRARTLAPEDGNTDGNTA